MSDDPAAAVVADRRELVDRALEAVERMGCPGGHDLEREIIVVPADLAPGHVPLLAPAAAPCRPQDNGGRKGPILPVGALSGPASRCSPPPRPGWPPRSGRGSPSAPRRRGGRP